MKTIQLTQGKFALVDEADFGWLSQYKWRTTGAGNCNVYAITTIGKRPNREMIRMHRFILGANQNQQIDHIDGDGFNNQKANLRFSTQQQNRFNQRPIKQNRMTSKYKGVSWCKRDRKWVAFIKINRVGKNLGLYKKEIQAAKAYDAKARELFGKFARLNFRQGTI